MNNFIFENPTKTYFGKGCVKEYLTCLVKHYGKNVMFAYGNDSIRNQGIYDEIIKRQIVSDSFNTLSRIMEIYFSKPDEDNVSDDIAEALMKNVIQNLKAAIINPEDYTARSNLIWDAAMAENRILKLGKQADFQCRQMEHQIAAYTNCNQGEGLAVLHPVYYRHIYKNGRSKFKKFAVNVWGISDLGRTEEETACEGVEALAGFIKEVGLPATLRDIGADENTDLKRIADSCILSVGSYKQMTHKEILEIFQECY